jgi:hypothetical protein
LWSFSIRHDYDKLKFIPAGDLEGFSTVRTDGKRIGGAKLAVVVDAELLGAFDRVTTSIFWVSSPDRAHCTGQQHNRREHTRLLSGLVLSLLDHWWIR